jgi:uncharacterized protein YkwD
MKRFLLHLTWITAAVFLLWRFAVAAERSERSAQWRPPPAVPSNIALASTSSMAALERRVFELTNEERRRHGLSLFEPDDVLAEAARGHSMDMMQRGYFDHVTPEGVTPQQRVASRHRRLVGLTGENVWSGNGYDMSDTEALARTIVDSWMKSPGHRENILRPDYTHLGVGLAVAGPETRATQSFAGVWAYLDAPLPKRVAPGDGLDLRATPYGGVRRPAELFVLAADGVAGDPRPVTGAKVQVAPGTYQLHLYFPEAAQGSYGICFGPMVVVE